MPAPISNFSTDKFFYDYVCNPLAKKICFISPNVISLFCFSLIFPIVYNIYKERSLKELLILVFLKKILDCLDGSVARNCNKTSKEGALLDILCDYVSMLLFISVVVIKISQSKKRFWLKFLLTIILISIVAQSMISLQKEIDDQHKDRFKKSIDIFLHDNTILLNLIFAVIVKYII